MTKYNIFIHLFIYELIFNINVIKIPKNKNAQFIII